ncbi:DUF3231 family protein [Bacillus sp. UNC438CL73TsuS30]|uniref:DUF3231 family protein n=1 Tax=Bacillus sp. UNC438CL73TsuS30 TaxID=1340434 RepID=UPI00047BCE85|nr:DUF3231 family protein [Bacillus sp. UNC438CL73TsuS30]
MEKKIVALDVSNLWTPYMNNTMALCVNKYALQTIQDPEINAVFCNALNIAENIVQKITVIFNQEHFPIPQGFTEEDVHLNAPRLFSDELWLFYLHQMSIHGLTAYSLGITASRRPDVRQFYFETYKESYELYETTLGMLQSKGFMERPPTIALPEKIEFAEKQNFLAGWFGHQRPLNTIEISSLYFNLQKTILTKDLALGFSQTAKLKEIRRFMEEVVKVAAEHIEIFTTILHEDFISSAITWDTHVTDSQIPPFSDKLMMFHCAFLIQAAMAYYGTALSGAMRRDLGLKYTSAIAKDVKLAEDCANILIANGWFEEPPSSVDRRELS